MLRGLFTAGTAMIAQNRRMEVISNNLVNVETTGYKQDVMITESFRDMLISRINDPSVYQYSMVGPHNTGIHIDTIYSNFATGSFIASDSTTDMALVDDGFFVLEYTPRTLIPPEPEDLADPDYEPDYEDGEPEERYTRAGNFQVDAEGYLVNPDGMYVLGLDGRILLETDDFIVNGEGEIYVGDTLIDTLLVVKFEDNGVLRKQGGNVFNVMESLLPNEDDLTGEDYYPYDVIKPNVKQFFLESSNVDMASETVRMMECYRAYEINQRVVSMYDESLGRTVNDIAKL